MNKILKKTLKQRSKPIEVMIGVCVPMIILILYIVFSEWRDEGPVIVFEVLFMIVFLSIVPIMSETVIFVAIILAISFIPIIKFIPSPYIRIAVGFHFSGWLYLGVLGTASLPI